MPDSLAALFNETARSHWVRLRTLIVLRWVAIAGQLAAIEFARHYFQIDLNLGLCYLAIGVAIIANLFAMSLFPENKRLSENETVLTLLFDITQLSFLLYLTGGLNNPFALLVLAPVTIASLALRVQSTLIVGMAAVGMITLIAFVFIPLRTTDGAIVALPDLFRFGYWTAIVIGVLFTSLYSRRVTVEINTMSEALLATQLALAREQKLTDLGGVVAAAAHELGTPLATIKLVSSELMEELEEQGDLMEDARLIRDQADRCRDILRSMGRAGKDDLHMRQAPISAVVREAAEPHSDRGKSIHFDVAPASGGAQKQPAIQRRPDVIHGIRNLVQNAVDFAQGNVWVEARWNEDQIMLRIMDDGPGFPTHLLGRIGDPFMRSRRGSGVETDRAQRPEYEGMGLGLFIAKTLLERSGASLAFANGTDPFSSPEPRPERGGAVVTVTWPTAEIVSTAGSAARPLGHNAPIAIG